MTMFTLASTRIPWLSLASLSSCQMQLQLWQDVMICRRQGCYLVKDGVMVSEAVHDNEWCVINCDDRLRCQPVLGWGWQRPNCWDAAIKQSDICWMSDRLWATRAQSSPNSRSQIMVTDTFYLRWSLTRPQVNKHWHCIATKVWILA